MKRNPMLEIMPFLFNKQSLLYHKRGTKKSHRSRLYDLISNVMLLLSTNPNYFAEEVILRPPHSFITSRTKTEILAHY